MNYKVLIADEAMDDIFGLVQYVHTELCNPDAAEKLYQKLKREVRNIGDFPLEFSESGIEYHGYVIHKKVYESYLIFYIVNREKEHVYILRVMKDLVDWQNTLTQTRIYHFPNYNE